MPGSRILFQLGGESFLLLLFPQVALLGIGIFFVNGFMQAMLNKIVVRRLRDMNRHETPTEVEQRNSATFSEIRRGRREHSHHSNANQREGLLVAIYRTAGEGASGTSANSYSAGVRLRTRSGAITLILNAQGMISVTFGSAFALGIHLIHTGKVDDSNVFLTSAAVSMAMVNMGNSIPHFPDLIRAGAAAPLLLRFTRDAREEDKQFPSSTKSTKVDLPPWT